MRWFPAALAALSLHLSCAPACAQPRAPQGPTWSLEQFLPSLRPWAREHLQRTAALRVHELPTYTLLVSLGRGERSFQVAGEVWYTNRERAPMREVVLRVYANATRREAGAAPPMRFREARCVTGTCAVREESPSVLVVRPAQPLAPGACLRLTFAYDGALSVIEPGRTNILSQGLESLSMLGSRESSGDYGLLATGDGVVSMANFFPVVARRAGGRWLRDDEGHVGDLGSDELSHVLATIDAPADHSVVTTGVTVRRSVSNDRSRTEVTAGAVRDFAVMMGASLQSTTRRVGEVEVRSWFLPADRAAGERVLDVAAHALEDFERRFGPYPYVDLDVVEAPLVGGAGGVEFPGLVTVASMFYRARATDSGLAGGLMGMLGLGNLDGMLSQVLPGMLEFVTAHEVAHQYWHGLVGSDSRAHPWLDESLAQWSAALYLEDRYGPERARRDADLNVRMNYQFMRMMGEADGPVDRPASAFASPTRYAGIVYGKGPYVYNALREAAGDEAFFRALRRYVDQWRFRAAPTTGFVDALAAESPAQSARYRALARRWLQETHGDEDMGEADLGAMMGGLLGGDGASPELRDAMRALGPLLQGLQRGGSEGSGSSPRGDAGAAPQRLPSGGDAQQLQRAVEELMQQLGGAQ